MAAISQLRVLIADDDSGSRDCLTSLLALEGFQTFSLDGGRAVLEFFHERATPRDFIHFLVLDNNMPDLSGLEVLRSLRFELGALLPAILVSGRADRDLEEAVLGAGGFALVPKPIRPAQFRQEVWRLVRDHELLG